MIKYLAKRIGQTLLVIIIVSIATFFLVSLMPKDPVYALLGSEITQEEYMAEFYRQNLDKPILVRYLFWVSDLLHGDFGISYIYNLPVWEVMGPKLAITIYLSIWSLLLSFPLGIVLGVITAVKRGKVADTVITLVSNLLSGVPQFVIALVMLYVFSMRLHLLPAIGFTWPWEGLKQHFLQMIMPLTCLVVQSAAGICRQTRSSMLEVLGQDYVRTARAKGLRESCVIKRHVINNGLIPIVTLIGNRLAFMIGGAMFVESVFSIPGMGTLMVKAINSMDIPIIQANVLLTALIISLAYILTDVLYVAIDPRISLN